MGGVGEGVGAGTFAERDEQANLLIETEAEVLGPLEPRECVLHRTHASAVVSLEDVRQELRPCAQVEEREEKPRPL